MLDNNDDVPPRLGNKDIALLRGSLSSIGGDGRDANKDGVLDFEADDDMLVGVRFRRDL